MSPASFLAAYLISEGFSNIFVGTLPNNKNQCTVFYDIGGLDPNPRWNRNYVDVKVVVRGSRSDYNEGYTIAKSIKNKLLGLEPLDSEGVIYTRFLMKGDIKFISYDANEQPLFMLNFQLVVDGLNEGNREEIV